MRTLERSRFRLTVAAAALMLAGCGQTLLSSPSGVVPHTSVRSWMLPDAAKGDLMYVADTKDNVVDVYTYPAGKPAGTLTGFVGLAFVCADTAGNVFVPSYGLSEIFEYAHGGTQPIATLKDSRATPYSCSVDPKTGDLAVANFSTEGGASGNVVIYRHAKGKPQTYQLEDIEREYFCAYDDKGDLFVESNSAAGSGGYFGLEELRKGARLFGPITLQNVPAYPNGLQWDGTYLAVGTGTLVGPSSGDTYVYHMQISNFIAKTVGTTQLAEHGPTGNFFIDGSTIVVSGGSQQSGVGFFNYPDGGAPAKMLTETSPYGVVVSAADRTIAHRATSGYQYQTIFSFQGFNGAAPDGVLVYYKGKLYGTTESGGYYSQGTVFSVTPSGQQTVLHNFGQPGDGVKPEAGLAVMNGVLYGTTYYGGAHNDGTVFSVTAGGNEHVLYSFGDTQEDSENPVASLTPLDGILYGTTLAGGIYNAGTVFTITPAGKETVLYRFPSYSKASGQFPFAGLIVYEGKLYGTTDSSGPCQEGTVFSITPSGNEKTIYGFPCKRYDGSNPQAGLVVMNGVLYGTTTLGGQAFYNDGTVFSVTTSGKEHVLFSFVPSTQYGFRADTSLVPLKGALYGTTPLGAANGAGALYSVTPAGTATVIHTFGIPPDGANPLAGLTNVSGTLYGTTSTGGGVANSGTVYRVTP